MHCIMSLGKTLFSNRKLFDLLEKIVNLNGFALYIITTDAIYSINIVSELEELILTTKRQLVCYKFESASYL